MGNTLSGLTPSQTFQGLIKVGNNTNVDGTAKVLSDGAGTDLPMEVSTAGVNFTGSPTVNSVAIANTNEVAAKQDTLVSGTNIKTINGTTVLGSGNIAVVTAPSGVAGAIQFSDGSAFASDAANLFWDDANKRLGVGTNTPTREIDVVGSIAVSNIISVGNLSLQSNFLRGIGSGIRLRVDTPSQGGVAVNTTPESNVTTLIRGWGTTTSTIALLVQNSAGTEAFRVEDSLEVKVRATFRVQDTGGNNAMIMYGDGFGGPKTLWVNGSVGIGVLGNNASARLQVDSTTQGFLPPRMTTTQKNAIATPAAGLVVYDTTLNKLCVYTTAWETITSL